MHSVQHCRHLASAPDMVASVRVTLQHSGMHPCMQQAKPALICLLDIQVVLTGNQVPKSVDITQEALDTGAEVCMHAIMALPSIAIVRSHQQLSDLLVSTALAVG